MVETVWACCLASQDAANKNIRSVPDQDGFLVGRVLALLDAPLFVSETTDVLIKEKSPKSRIKEQHNFDFHLLVESFIKLPSNFEIMIKLKTNKLPQVIFKGLFLTTD